MTVDTRPSTRCYPRTDTEFAEDVERALDETGDSPGMIVLSLQPKYPTIVITVQDALAAVPGDPPVWYCYRDGSALG